MKRSGQYTLIEQVVLFAIGISITLGFLVAFQDLSEDIESDMATLQSRLVARYAASSAVELAESGAEGRIVVDIPETVASRVYALRFSGGEVEVETTGVRETVSLYGLSATKQSSGVVESSSSPVTIRHRNDNLLLSDE